MTPKTPFAKYSVAGNDFILIDQENYTGVPAPAQMCHRRISIGADQLVLVGAAQAASHEVTIYNPDGSVAPFCGNALLAVGSYLTTQGRGGASGIELRCAATATRFFSRNGLPTIEMPSFSLLPTATRARQVHDSKAETLVACGTFHYVVVMDRIRDIDIAEVGSRLEHTAATGQTTNVIFVEILDFRSLQIAPWERGGTGATLACGSGAYSATIVAAQLAQEAPETDLPTLWSVRCPGGTLSVELGRSTGLLSAAAACTFHGFIG